MFGKMCSKNDPGKKALTQASARVVEGKLILSLPEALKPVVWQMDLGQAKASALELCHNTDQSEFRLVLKTPRGEAVDIAVFANRTQAMDGLMAASGALENAQGQIRGAGVPFIAPFAANDGGHHGYILSPQALPQKRRGRWIGFVLGIVVVIVIALLWSAPAMPPSGRNQDSSLSRTENAPPELENGVPLSADDFLKAQ